MGNMSYCRFHNTVNDLEDCREHMHDRNLSEKEHNKRKKLIKICRDISEAFEHIDNIDEHFSDNEQYGSD